MVIDDNTVLQQPVDMKATIEIPHDLYRQVKARAALQGHTIREVTIELYQAWLAQEPMAKPSVEPSLSPEQWVKEWIRLGQAALSTAPQPEAAAIVDERSPEQAMEDLFKLADELMANAPPGPTAREILEEDRSRLER